MNGNNGNYQHQPANGQWYQGHNAGYDIFSGAYDSLAAAGNQEPAYDVWPPHAHPHQEHADYAAQPYQDEGDDQADYYGADYYSEPEVEEPQTRRSRRRNRRRHDGTRGPHARVARPRNPYRPLLHILQPVTNGADITMDMSLAAFDALFERQLGGYVPGMDFKDRTGASITGLKNLDGQIATIVIKGSHSQVAEAYELLTGHNIRYSIEANANEDDYGPRRPRCR
ncbi:hypothetical protein BKA61DRAFT_707634 [Leptodontidium sp. MPI-SDFR-AT-0119]|nr:hypothetical protein BKA61DRAFT_707634 [Leptodontidium sp. MPI-SDFR-AT-0119]